MCHVVHGMPVTLHKLGMLPKQMGSFENLPFAKLRLQDSFTRICETPDKPVGLGKSLRTACKKGDWDEVKTLLDNGVEYSNRCRKDGSSAFHIAAQNGHLQVVQGLWGHLQQPAILEEANNCGATPLYQRGFVDIVMELVRADADVNRLVVRHDAWRQQL